uniref:Uncharacterized protein n=1 Tax=Oryza nivara TaxID=4536 RepID=A0A0E0FWE6_ORYNI
MERGKENQPTQQHRKASPSESPKKKKKTPLYDSTNTPPSPARSLAAHIYARLASPLPLLLLLVQNQREALVAHNQLDTAARRTNARRGHGEVAMLREGAHEQGGVDEGGGPAADRLHQGARRGLLAVAAQGGGAPPLRQELPPPLDELPPPRPQARQLHRRRRRAHHQAPRPSRQQVVVDCGAAAGEDGQRDQELLEHAHQAQAPEPGHRPADAPAGQRREQRRRGERADHDGQHRRLSVPCAGAAAAATQATQPGARRGAEQCELRQVRGVPAVGGRPQQQRRQLGRAAVPRPQPRPRPRPVHEPAELAAQDAGRRVVHDRVAPPSPPAAEDHLPLLPPRRPQRRRLQLQGGRAIAGRPTRVPVSQATGGGPVHIAQ